MTNELPDEEREFDERMRRLVRASVDRRLGVERPAPHFQPAARRRRPLPTWLLPLAVAASVAVLLGGTVGVVRLAGGGSDDLIPPGQTTSVSSVPTTVPGSSAPAPAPSGPNCGVLIKACASRGSASSVHRDPPSTQHTASHPTSSRSPSTSSHEDPPATSFTMQQLGDAQVAVPTGWAAQRFGGDYQAYDVWCLLPEGTTFDPGDLLTCPIFFRQIASGGGGAPAIDVDRRGATYGDPGQPCGANVATRNTVGNAVRDFGGRSAEYRFFTIDCPDGTGLRWEQYVVPTDRSYVVFAPHVDADGVQSALSTVALNSVLPTQDLPLRLEDYGIVQSMDQQDDGVTITLDRVAAANGDNDDPTTYEYFLPTSVLGSYPNLAVGQTTYVYTDGNQVIGA